MAQPVNTENVSSFSRARQSSSLLMSKQASQPRKDSSSDEPGEEEGGITSGRAASPGRKLPPHDADDARDNRKRLVPGGRQRWRRASQRPLHFAVEAHVHLLELQREAALPRELVVFQQPVKLKRTAQVQVTWPEGHAMRRVFRLQLTTHNRTLETDLDLSHTQKKAVPQSKRGCSCPQERTWTSQQHTCTHANMQERHCHCAQSQNPRSSESNPSLRNVDA